MWGLTRGFWRRLAWLLAAVDPETFQILDPLGRVAAQRDSSVDRIGHQGDLGGIRKEMLLNEPIHLRELDPKSRMRVVPPDHPQLGVIPLEDGVDDVPRGLGKGDVRAALSGRRAAYRRLDVQEMTLVILAKPASQHPAHFRVQGLAGMRGQFGIGRPLERHPQAGHGASRAGKRAPDGLGRRIYLPDFDRFPIPLLELAHTDWPGAGAAWGPSSNGLSPASSSPTRVEP